MKEIRNGIARSTESDDILNRQLQHEKRFLGIRMKCLHTRTFCGEQVGDGVGSRVTNAQPDHFRRLPPDELS